MHVPLWRNQSLTEKEPLDAICSLEYTVILYTIKVRMIMVSDN